MEIHASARRRQVLDDDMRHAVEQALAVEDVGEDPDRWLVIGPDRAGNLLELVAPITIEGTEMIIPPCRCARPTGGC